MDKISVRIWLERNKIWFQTIAAALISIMAIIVSIAQLVVMDKQSTIAEMQYLSSLEPLISIEPNTLIRRKNGTYTLKIKNNGILDLCNLGIYENYLVCPCEMKGKFLACPTDNPTISSIATLPTKRYENLKVGDEIIYTIDTNKEIVETANGKRYPCFMRLRIDYHKKVDGKPYSKIFAFGVGEMLVNLDTEGGESWHPNFNRVRDFLLNKF